MFVPVPRQNLNFQRDMSLSFLCSVSSVKSIDVSLLSTLIYRKDTLMRHVPEIYNHNFDSFIPDKNVGHVNCSMNNGECQQTCTDLQDGGYYCSCRKGFTLSSSDKKSCDGNIPFIVLNEIFLLRKFIRYN